MIIVFAWIAVGALIAFVVSAAISIVLKVLFDGDPDFSVKIAVLSVVVTAIAAAGMLLCHVIPRLLGKG